MFMGGKLCRAVLNTFRMWLCQFYNYIHSIETFSILISQLRINTTLSSIFYEFIILFLLHIIVCCFAFITKFSLIKYKTYTCVVATLLPMALFRKRVRYREKPKRSERKRAKMKKPHSVVSVSISDTCYPETSYSCLKCGFSYKIFKLI